MSIEKLNNIGVRLQEELNNLNFSAPKFATKMGVNKGTVYNWLNKGNIPADKLSVAGEIGVDVVYVLKGERMHFDTEKTISNVTNESIDTQLLHDSIKTLELALKQTRRKMTPENKAKMIVAIYDYYNTDKSGTIVQDNVVKLVAGIGGG